MAPWIEHQQAVAHFEQFVEIFRHDEHGGAAVARVAQAARAHQRTACVEAAGRIKRDDQFRFDGPIRAPEQRAADCRRKGPPRGPRRLGRGKSSRAKLRLMSRIELLPVECPSRRNSAARCQARDFRARSVPATQAKRSGSSGMAATPFSRIVAIDHRDASSPHNNFFPVCGCFKPRIRSPSSRWPLPETPAMPTISPAWIFIEMLRARFPRCRRR